MGCIPSRLSPNLRKLSFLLNIKSKSSHLNTKFLYPNFWANSESWMIDTMCCFIVAYLIEKMNSISWIQLQQHKTYFSISLKALMAFFLPGLIVLELPHFSRHWMILGIIQDKNHTEIFLPYRPTFQTRYNSNQILSFIHICKSIVIIFSIN